MGVLLPSNVSPWVYRSITQHSKNWFPRLEARFNFQGKTRQVHLFHRMGVRHPDSLVFKAPLRLQDYLSEHGSPWGYPIVLKGDLGGGGETVFAIYGQEDVPKYLLDLPQDKPLLIQKWVEHGGKDLRVVIYGDQAVSYFRVGGGQFYNNICRGGKLDKGGWPELQQKGVSAVRSFCGRALGRFAFIAAVLVVIGLAIGLVPRWFARQALAKETAEMAVQTVAVVSPEPGKSDLGVPLPAEVQAFVEAPIYARASGYLKTWDVDIGEHVEAGQLLAEIDTPELDQQLEQAKAEVAQADAALTLAKSTSERWTELLKTASVSEQETAEKQADYELKKADLEAANANLHRLQDLKSFARVTAPFTGTITARDTDVGQLITAGSGRPLFRLAQTNPLGIRPRAADALTAD